MDKTHMHRPAHVVVIGGGITGLAAAWELAQRAGPAVAVTLLDNSDRWGGKIQTLIMPGPGGARFVADAGPESFITRKRAVWDLAHALGLQDRLTDPGSETRNIYVLHEGRPMKVPLDPAAFLTSPLLSLGGKLRLLAEPLVRARRDPGDESLADFAARRLGREATRRLVGPILGGIYNTDPERQSVLTTAPVMRELESRHGSLVAGAIARARDRRRARARGERIPPAFIAFRDGAQELVDALVQRLAAEERVRLQLRAGVVRVERLAGSFAVARAGAAPLAADAVIVATPANAAAGLIGSAAPASALGLQRIRHGDIGTISLAYRSADLGAAFRLNGLMIPREARRRIDAVTWTSARLPGRAPRGAELVRVFFGGGDPEMIGLDEARLVAEVTRELRALIGLDATPLDAAIARWPGSFPQADVGHLERLADLERHLPAGLLLAGSSYRGLGVPDCVQQGQAAAGRVLAELAARQPLAETETLPA